MRRTAGDTVRAATAAILAAGRAVGSALATTVRDASRLRIVLTATAALALVAVALWVPLPTALQVRDWAGALGAWFPLAFFAAHIVITVLPVPRTAFTLSAGLLFGPALGVALAVTASACSALIALLLVRAAGWRLQQVTDHPRLGSLDDRLRTRGWPAVLSLRLIPAVPFSVLNYAAGASAVRVWPYLLATVVGLLPGTTAVVVLGDALTGQVDPLLLAVSACTAAIGISGLVYESYRYRRDAVPGPGGAARG